MKVRVDYERSVTPEVLISAIDHLIWYKRKANIRNQWRSLQHPSNGYHGEVKDASFCAWQYPHAFYSYPGLQHLILRGKVLLLENGPSLLMEASLNKIGRFMITCSILLLLSIAYMIAPSAEDFTVSQMIAPVAVVLVPILMIYLILRVEEKAEIDYFLGELDKKIARIS